MSRSKDTFRPWSAPILRSGHTRAMAAHRMSFYCTADDLKHRNKAQASFNSSMQVVENVAKQMKLLQAELVGARLQAGADSHLEKGGRRRYSLSARTRTSHKEPMYSLVETEQSSDTFDNCEHENVDINEETSIELNDEMCSSTQDTGVQQDKEDASLRKDETDSSSSDSEMSDNAKPLKSPLPVITEGSASEIDQSSSEYGKEEASWSENHEDDDDAPDVVMEMTFEEKQAMHNAVRKGDIDLLEDLLDLPNADINMEWYDQNLLMVAIRCRQSAMAEFLLDNGVDPNFEAVLMDMKIEDDKKESCCDMYRIACRQMAYDYGMMNVVEIIDLLNNSFPSYLTPMPRAVRLRRPPKPLPEIEDSEYNDISDEHSSNDAAQEKMKQPDEKKEKVKSKLNTKKSIVEDNTPPVPPNQEIDRMDFVSEWRKSGCTYGACANGTLEFPGWTVPTVQESPLSIQYKETKSLNLRKKHTLSNAQQSFDDKFISHLKVNCRGSYNRERKMWSHGNHSQWKSNKQRHVGNVFSASHTGAFSDTDTINSSPFGSGMCRSMQSNRSYTSKQSRNSRITDSSAIIKSPTIMRNTHQSTTHLRFPKKLAKR